MSTTARLEELKRDLAQVENGQNRTRRSGGGSERGREADHPGEIPPKGWMDILWRAWGEVSEQNLFLIAGGVTYAILLALFPGLASLVSLYGLVLDASQIEKQVSALSGILPAQTQQLLTDQLHQLVESSSGTLGIGAGVGIVLALWSASRGMSGLITALNIAYEEKERRGFFKLNMIALGLTLGLMVGGVVVIALVAVLPAAVQFLDLGAATKWLLLVVEWPLLIVLVMLGLAVLYRYAPDRDEPQWRWVSPGAIAATILWVVASIGFTVYVANFNSYDKTVRIAGWRDHPADLALPVGAGGPVRRGDQCAIGEADPEGFDERFAARDGTTRCTGCRYTWRKQALMAENKELDRLQRRLTREAPAPLTDLSNQMTASVSSLLRALAQWVRDSAEEMPLISLLIAFEAGFAVARLGHRRAKH